MMQDPFQYIGRITERDEQGRARKAEILYPTDTEIHINDGDEFFTFVTVIDLTTQERE